MTEVTVNEELTEEERAEQERAVNEKKLWAALEEVIPKINNLRWRVVYTKHYKMTTQDIQSDMSILECVALNEFRKREFGSDNLKDTDAMTPKEVEAALLEYAPEVNDDGATE